jgi:AraC-like DNA-binding protein
MLGGRVDGPHGATRSWDTRSTVGDARMIRRTILGFAIALLFVWIALVATIGGRYASRVTDEPSNMRDLKRLRRVKDRIDREYAEPLDVEALARDAHMSAGHLSRGFKAAYGESPYSYLMTRRIERAMALLRRGDQSVTEVCFAVGCSSLGTFSTRFTELVGMSPSAYRRDPSHVAAGIPSCLAKQVTKPVRNREAPLSDRS